MHTRLLLQPVILFLAMFFTSRRVTSYQLMFVLWRYRPMRSLIDLFSLVRSPQVSSLKVVTDLHIGESLPLPGTVEHSDENYLETKNIGLQGTHCISGSGIGVVVSTGDATVFGKIAKMTNAPKTGMTPLEREILNFVLIICSIMVTMIVIVIIVWYEIHPTTADCFTSPFVQLKSTTLRTFACSLASVQRLRTFPGLFTLYQRFNT
jgi:hypothetical protein